MSIYEKNGYSDRRAYLVDLADQYGVDYETVSTLANVLGEDEDFDGLINELEDAQL